MIAKLCILFGLCAGNISGPVEYVYDGDTIKVDGRHIRLQGLDAEELSEPNGPGAREVMQAIVAGKAITCIPDGTTSHSRIVAVCYAGSIDIAIALVAGGWALDCPRYSKGRYRAYEPADARNHLIQKGYCR